jgi:RNA polymerase sigma-70 factor (ECF subfamily)
MGCARNQRESQKMIYNSFYGYGMSVCLRYTSRHEDALEIYNDSFLKIFKEIYHYKPLYANEVNSFKGWIRKIMIYTAIDHVRKNNKHSFTGDFETAVIYLKDNEENALDRMSYEEIIGAIQQLSPAYRTVLNLYIIDGFTHEEIANQLGISIGTSKSNLFKARQQLQQILKNENKIQITKNVG